MLRFCQLCTNGRGTTHDKVTANLVKAPETVINIQPAIISLLFGQVGAAITCYQSPFPFNGITGTR